MRIVIPLESNEGENSKVSWHFGRASYFAIFDTVNKKLEIIENRSEHFGGVGKPAEIIAKIQPDMVFAKGMGPKAIQLLTSRGIKVVTGNYSILKEIIQNIDKLVELNESCKE
ncbi:MAG: NifB/NifX family molybdenum-iron cluster-binding protein [Candidatus Aenigmarchaeota archaeon]|nr:NifB/NifX family molybdenum-iron cluster-binding protein [Candidatus Aenigmarchaeota archaeon]